MSAQASPPLPSDEPPAGCVRSNYPTERSPVTSLLLAGKKTVVLPLLRPEEGQPLPAKQTESGGSESKSASPQK